MKKREMLPWDEYWRLVLKVHRTNGLTSSIPEKEMRFYYHAELSPLDAAHAAFESWQIKKGKTK